MSELLTTTVRDALQSGRLAHLATINADGSPQVTIIWVGLHGDEIVSGHLMHSHKLRNVERDPRVMLTMECEGRNEIGLDHYLAIRGTARVTDGGAPELLQRLAHVYLGPEVKFPPFDGPPPGYTLRITPERISGVGPWA